MADRLVRLYDLPDTRPALEPLAAVGVTIRRARAYEKFALIQWVQAHFDDQWAGECDVGFGNHPISCFMATRGGIITGFACYECTCRGFFGPIGIARSDRRKGIGKALLLRSLAAMHAEGYAYAVIGGGDGVARFYETTVGAMEISGSTPGIYRDRLRKAPQQ